MSEWQPIETAPRDGTDVLIVDISATKPTASIAHFWSDDCWICCHAESYSEAIYGEIEVMGDPSHWMPLPTPPSGQGRE